MIETERKFLVRDQSWRTQARASTEICQAYLSRDERRTVRVRKAGATAWLTLKAGSTPLERLEFEYEIPTADADVLMEKMALGPVIKKRRHFVPADDGHLWEIDEFESPNPGLLVAEIELKDRDESFARYPWLGDEVTDDPRYLNHNMLGA